MQWSFCNRLSHTGLLSPLKTHAEDNGWAWNGTQPVIRDPTAATKSEQCHHHPSTGHYTTSAAIQILLSSHNHSYPSGGKHGSPQWISITNLPSNFVLALLDSAHTRQLTKSQNHFRNAILNILSLMSINVSTK